MRSSFLILASLLFSLAHTAKADVVIVNGDGAGEGFNDTTAVSSVGGNPGTTLGQQRLNVFQQAADILNSTYDISVVVNVNAQFNPLTCSSSSGVLGSAGPAEYEFVWETSTYRIYPHALYNQMAGSDVNASAVEINATFNSSIDNNNSCLNGTNWYYGYDAPGAYELSLLSVVLHEILHGMGFLSLLQSDGSSAAYYWDGAQNQDIYDPYTLKLKDAASGNMLSDMSAAARASVMTSVNNLVWSGTQVNAESGNYSNGVNGGQMKMYAPASYESGSSVSHFDTTVTPNEVMEPSYTEFLDEPGLATELLADIGWGLAAVSNTAPVLSAIGNQNLNEDASLNVSLSASDGEGDTLAYSLTSASSSLGASISGSTLTISPTADYNGSGSLTVQVSDGSLTDSESISVTVNAVNDAPVLASISNQTTNEDTSKQVNLSASDVDGDSLSYSVTAASAELSTSVSGSQLIITPQADWYGTGNMTVQVSDGSLTDSQTFSVTVNAVNDAPVLSAIGAQSLAEDGSLSVSLSATDTDGDGLTFSLTSATSALGASISGSTLTITPDADYNGSGSLTVQVSDGGLSDSETLSVTVTAVNDAPEIDPVADQTLDLDGQKTISLTAADVDGDSLTYSASSADTSIVTTSVSGTNLTITATGQSGENTLVTVTVSDGQVTDTAQFNVTLADTLITLDVSGSELSDGDSVEVSLESVSLTFSGGTSPYDLSVYYDGSDRTELISGSGSSFSLSMPASGAFAGAYRVDVSDASGGSATYYLERPLRLSVDTAPLMSGSDSASIIIEGAPAFTDISLSSDSNELSFANADGNAISFVTAPDHSDDFNTAIAWLSAGASDEMVVTASAANIPDSAVDTEIAPRRQVTLRVMSASGTGIESASVELMDERASGWGLETQFETASNGSLTLTLPDVDVTFDISANGFEGTTLVLGEGLTTADVSLDALASSYLLHGQITASGFDFSTELPEVTVTLSDGNQVSVVTEQVSAHRVDYEWSPANGSQVGESLTISHSQSGSVMLDLTPAASEEIVDISLSALTIDNGTGTTEDPGSSTDETDTSTDNNSENGTSDNSSKPSSGFGANSPAWLALMMFGLLWTRRNRQKAC